MPDLSSGCSLKAVVVILALRRAALPTCMCDCSLGSLRLDNKGSGEDTQNASPCSSERDKPTWLIHPATITLCKQDGEPHVLGDSCTGKVCLQPSRLPSALQHVPTVIVSSSGIKWQRQLGGDCLMRSGCFDRACHACQQYEMRHCMKNGIGPMVHRDWVMLHSRWSLSSCYQNALHTRPIFQMVTS